MSNIYLVLPSISEEPTTSLAQTKVPSKVQLKREALSEKKGMIYLNLIMINHKI